MPLGHRRLSILDLSPAGHQPMLSPDGRYVIAYNGEVYNFLELRGELEAEGARFTTRTDTEVILALYAKEGPACLDRFRGMFAIAIWDRLERRSFSLATGWASSRSTYGQPKGSRCLRGEGAARSSGRPSAIDPEALSSISPGACARAAHHYASRRVRDARHLDALDAVGPVEAHLLGLPGSGPKAPHLLAAISTRPGRRRSRCSGRFSRKPSRTDASPTRRLARS